MSGAFDKIAEAMGANERGEIPVIGSFMEFLTEHARVKTDSGYAPYSLEGREALIPIIETFDLVLGSHTGVPLPDANIAICGGAQFGKTILALNFGAYLTACRWMNWGYYLPDDDLVQGIVDTKLRPDVIEQIEWLGPLMQVGKLEDKRGKSVNRKGAFQVSDGVRKAFGMIRGMGKIPTTFSMDVAMEDEKDDIKASRSKYLTGRLTASKLRLRSSIGTQRLHAAGQQKEWEDGSQGVFLFDVGDGRRINLEETWPDCCRFAVDGTPKATDPKLTIAGDFRDAAGRSWAYKPGSPYYFADPDTGAVIDRSRPILEHRKPERIELRKWSFRISQFAIGGLSINQFVSRWQVAVADPEMMVVFRCDVMAMPANTEQALSPEILKRARETGDAFDLAMKPSGLPRFAGLDTGNRCWFVSREVESEAEKRIHWAEQIPLSQMVARTEELCRRMGVACLAIDANPAVDQARQLCYLLNELTDVSPLVWAGYNRILETGSVGPHKGIPPRLTFPGGLIWDGLHKRWEGLRCFVVEFTLKPGSGIVHKLGVDPQNGFTKYFPVIQASRFDSINRVVGEFLTSEEAHIQVVDGRVLNEPVMRLPIREPGGPPIIETMDAHFLTGSKREKTEDGEAKDFVDQCENHLFLSNAYSRLAEMQGGHGVYTAPFAYQAVDRMRPQFRRKGGGL